MAENEPQGGDRDEAVTSPDDAAETVAPARRTRAPRRKATPAAEAPAEAGADAEVATPPVKATRSRRKAAAPAAQPALISEDAAEGAAAEDASAAEGPAAEVAEVPAAPVKAVRSRRKKAAAPAAPAPEEEEDATVVVAEPAPAEPEVSAPIVAVLPLDDELIEEEPAPRARAAALPPAVLFMPPEADPEPAPKVRRTRRGATAVPAVTAEPAEPVEDLAAVADSTETTVEEPAEGTRSRSRSRRRRPLDEPAEAVIDVPALDEPDETADEIAESDADLEADGEDDDDDSAAGRRRRRRGRRGRGRGKGPADEGDEDEPPVAEAEAEAEAEEEEDAEDGDGVTRRRRRRRRKGAGGEETGGIEDGVHTVVRVREPRRTSDEVQGVSGSTRLEAKRQRRRDGREQRRTRPPILSESEFLARREAVDRVMVVRQKPDRTQIAVLEDGVLVEHYVSRTTSGTMVGNVYLGKVQNVLPSMEAAFVDVGRGRNAVLYAGEVNWDATGLEGRARSIEQALRSGDSVLVQVTKDPIGHKGARLSSHIALSGRHLVYVPNGNASGISRKLPDNERKRLRDVLKKMVPDGAGVIVRTAAEGASEDELARDVKRLQAQWEDIQARAAEGHAPAALSEEPDLVIRVVRDLFNEDFREVVIQGEQAFIDVENYLDGVSPELLDRLHRYTGTNDIFADKRIDEQILKALDRKVFLPSGGHLVIDRTEAMTVVDVNTGKYTGAGGNLEETVTRNNLEAAEEIVRQLRLRDLGGIVVIDFIDMVLESNRELVLRRLTECLGRDRTKHQVTEITSLGLVQMTRKRIGAGLLEAFSETCDHCKGRGVIIHTEPVPEKRVNGGAVSQVKAVASASTRSEAPAVAQHNVVQHSPVQQAQPQSQAPSNGRSRRRRGGGSESVAEPVIEVVEVTEVLVETPAPQHAEENPVDEVAGKPPVVAAAPVAGSGVIGSGVIGSGVIGSGVIGSGVIGAVAKPALSAAGSDDDYDMSGYDLSRYEAPAAEPEDDEDEVDEDAEPLLLTGTDDPDAADEEEDDDEPAGAGAGRRRSRRGGTRRRTRP